MDPVAAYFHAERLESLLFLAVGVAALVAAAMLWWGRRSPQARGSAVALAAVAAIQCTVGATIYARTPGDLARVQAQVQGDRDRILSDEVPRMRAVMRNFEIYRWIEIALLGGGALLVWRGRKGSWVRGIGLGLVPQSALMLLLDAFAEARGDLYLAHMLRV